tara:strand:- start:430 stop:780 length:351 start_codon:yes stop_codon:yes gene_type:complete
MNNAFETKASYKESTTVLRTQIKSLKNLLKLDKTQREIIKPIIFEKMKMLKYISGLKSWNFNFEGGGWNSNVAKTKEESYKMALKEYKGSKNCVPSKETFRVATHADTRNLLSLFY